MSDSQITFGGINLVVSDVATSRSFYARLGLQFANSHEPVWDRHHLSAHQTGADGSELSFDLDSAAFAQKWNAGWSGGPGVVLGFSVPTRQAVDDLVAELVAELVADGVTVQQPPYDAFWGSRYAVVSDPDGNAVGIMSPPDEAHRGAYPDPEAT
jgi:catechol 2,3-dioxygenase-like lactoylglutathione lyase family enzyme